MAKVFVLLSRSQTYIAKKIRKVTGDTFSHSSLAFDEKLETLVSFARRFRYVPVPAGLMREDLGKGYFGHHQDIFCRLVEFEVSEDSFLRMKDRVEGMLKEYRKYKYDIKGLFAAHKGIRNERPFRYFCSQFVSEILEMSDDISLPKVPFFMRPQDIAEMPGGRCVFEGTVKELRSYVKRPCEQQGFDV